MASMPVARGLVIAAGIQGITDEQHVGDGDAAFAGEPFQRMRLVDAGARDHVDGGGAAEPDREMGQQAPQLDLQGLALAPVGVPVAPGLRRRRLAEPER